VGEMWRATLRNNPYRGRAVARAALFWHARQEERQPAGTEEDETRVTLDFSSSSRQQQQHQRYLMGTETVCCSCKESRGSSIGH